jgi:hypothetical protein
MKKSHITFLISICLTGCISTNNEKMEQAVLNQISQYPASTLQDIYKNFYQDRFGAEHAIPTEAAARDYLVYEVENLSETSVSQPVEEIGWEHNFVRVHLCLVKDSVIPLEELLNAFLESAAAIDTTAQKHWLEEWAQITEIIEKNNLPIADFEKDKAEIAQLLKEHPRMALHHSRIYNEKYHPHYRIVAKTVFDKRLKKYVGE